MRRLTKPGLTVLLIGLAGTLLAACASDDTPPPPCPVVYIIADGAKLTRFKPGPGRDIIDVLHEEEMTGFAHGCEYDLNDDGSGELTVQVVPNITSKRGPANQSGKAEFEYFLALTDSDKKILKKDRFPVSLTYTSNIPNLRWQPTEIHTYSIKLPAGKTGQDFNVYLGLQLTRAEVEYERTQR